MLNNLIKKTKILVEQKKKEYSYDWLGRSLAYNNYPPRDVLEHLKSSHDDPYRIICEISKDKSGKLDFLVQAQEFSNASANLLSVVTSEFYRDGAMEHLSGIRRYTSTPLLQKDFIIDTYQLLEAAVFGADCVQLHVCALSQRNLKELIAFSRRLGMEPMVDIHSKEELTKAIFAGAVLISINHRNLYDLSLDMELCYKLVPLIPKGKVIVAQGGIDSKDMIEDLSRVGVDGFLMSGYFLDKEDKTSSLRELKEFE